MCDKNSFCDDKEKLNELKSTNNINAQKFSKKILNPKIWNDKLYKNYIWMWPKGNLGDISDYQRYIYAKT